MLVLVFSYMYLLTHIYKNIGNIVNSGIVHNLIIPMKRALWGPFFLGI